MPHCFRAGARKVFLPTSVLRGVQFVTSAESTGEVTSARTVLIVRLIDILEEFEDIASGGENQCALLSSISWYDSIVMMNS